MTWLFVILVILAAVAVGLFFLYQKAKRIAATKQIYLKPIKLRKISKPKPAANEDVFVK